MKKIVILLVVLQVSTFVLLSSVYSNYKNEKTLKNQAYKELQEVKDKLLDKPKEIIRVVESERNSDSKVVEAQVEELKEESTNTVNVVDNQQKKEFPKTWNKMSEEEREQKRQEGIKKFNEWAQSMTQDFITKNNISEDKVEELYDVVNSVHAQIDDVMAQWKNFVEEEGALYNDYNLRIVYDLLGAVIEGYDKMDSVLPENWRENSADYDIGILMVNMKAFMTMEELNRKYGKGSSGGFGPMMGGRPPRPRNNSRKVEGE